MFRQAFQNLQIFTSNLNRGFDDFCHMSDYGRSFTMHSEVLEAFRMGIAVLLWFLTFLLLWWLSIAVGILFLGGIASAPMVNNWGLIKVTLYGNSTEPQAIVSFGVLGYCIFDVPTQHYNCSTLQAHYNASEVILQTFDVNLRTASAPWDDKSVYLVLLLDVLWLIIYPLVCMTVKVGFKGHVWYFMCLSTMTFSAVRSGEILKPLALTTGGRDDQTAELDYLGLYIYVFHSFAFYLAYACFHWLRTERGPSGEAIIPANEEDQEMGTGSGSRSGSSEIELLLKVE